MNTPLLLLLCFTSYLVQAQEVIVHLEDDYHDDQGKLWQSGDDFQQRYIENGMYISKAGKLGPELTFPLDINQLACKLSSDMEFAIIKLKGDNKEFIQLKLKPNNQNNTYLDEVKFLLNGAGEWRLGEKYTFSLLQSGTYTPGPGPTNLKVIHRGEKIEFHLNGSRVAEHTFPELTRIKWGEVTISAESKKIQLALDKVNFTGYLDERNKKLDEFELERFSTIRFSKIYRRWDAFIVNEGNKKRIIDDRGRISRNTYEFIDGSPDGPWLIVADKLKTVFGYIDTHGELMVPMTLKAVREKPCLSGESDCVLEGWYRVRNERDEIEYVNPKNKEQLSSSEALRKLQQATQGTMENTSIATTLAEPSKSIQTKHHLLHIYTAWSDLFIHPENYEDLSTQLIMSEETPRPMTRKAADVFSNGPEGWIRNGSRFNEKFTETINIRLSEIESTVAKEQAEILQWYQKFGGKRKYKTIDEEVTLADGRKGILLSRYTGYTEFGVAVLSVQILAVSTINPKLVSHYAVSIETFENIDLPEQDFRAWTDYLKKVILTIKKSNRE